MWSKFFKRIFDFCFALLLCILLCWLFVILLILVRIVLGSPVIFKQERVGRSERIFKVYKFRSMTDRRDQKGMLLPDEIRLTCFGRFLRHSSLDELPQLWNILKGDMSVVGPRPLLVEYLPLYDDEQRRRHFVRPGLTGWAQVNGRNTISWQEKFKLDVWYVDHQDFFLDLKILLLTIKRVLGSQGIQQAGQATVEKFNGAN